MNPLIAPEKNLNNQITINNPIAINTNIPPPRPNLDISQINSNTATPKPIHFNPPLVNPSIKPNTKKKAAEIKKVTINPNILLPPFKVKLLVVYIITFTLRIVNIIVPK